MRLIMTEAGHRAVHFNCKPGEVFEAPDAEAQVHLLLGNAIPAPDPYDPPPPRLERAEEPPPESTDLPSDEPDGEQRPTRRYRRRDMQAEEE